MYSKTTRVINKLGIHARPASNITLKSKEFACSIMLKNLDDPNARQISAKSVMKLLAACLSCGTNIEISAEGEDERQAVQELVRLFQSGFSEE